MGLFIHDIKLGLIAIKLKLVTSMTDSESSAKEFNYLNIGFNGLIILIRH